jgi:hypothetical protein
MFGKITIYLLLFVLFTKDSNSPDHYSPKIKSHRKIIAETFIPNSYQFNTVPKLYGESYHYFDEKNRSLIFLNTAFEFSNSIVLGGMGSKSLGRIYQTSTAGNLFFAFGSKGCVVVNLETKKKYDVFKHELILAQSVAKFKDGFLIGNVSTTNEFQLSYFEFDEEKGLINFEPKVSIPFDEGTDIGDMSGHIAVFENSIVFVKDWIGEAYSYDYNFNLKKRKQLDFSGYLELNINRDDDNDEFTYRFFQAYSIAKTPNNLLAVMREIDFEDNDLLDLNNVTEEFFRKKIHFFDEGLNYKGGLKLDYFSTDIHFQGNKLLTLNYQDEPVIEYELDN